MIKKYNFIVDKTISLNEFLQKKLREEILKSNANNITKSEMSSDSSCNAKICDTKISSCDVKISNGKIRRLIVSGGVSVNHKQCRLPSFLLKKGSTVSVLFDSGKFFYEKQNDDIKFELTESAILYEDEFLIVVNKPAFFLSERTFSAERDNMHSAVIRYLHKKNPKLRNPPYVGIMHRLDRTTSGVLLFTKMREVNKAMHEIFEQRIAKKVYRAFAIKPNHAIEKEFVVENYIGRITPKGSVGMWGEVKEGGKPALTEFSVLDELEYNGCKTLYVEARPRTGRTHQIRVHLAQSGVPVLGDDLYGNTASRGNSPEIATEKIKTGEYEDASKNMYENVFENAERVFLHAYSLSFPHPKTREMLCVVAPLPDDFIRVLGKH